MRRTRPLSTLVAGALAAAVLVPLGLVAPAEAGSGRSPAPPASPVPVRLISFNDFHGNLEPPTGSSGRVVQADGTTVDAGGAAYLATHLKQLRAAAPNSIALSTGDSIGASPLISAAFHDEPTIAVLNALGLTASVVGNHEFDEGYRELVRMQLGGCHPTDGCQFQPRFRGANFPFLGANVTFTNGIPAVLPFTIKIVKGIPVGVIGVTLKNLPDVVTAEAIKNLKFGDEVAAIDKASATLDRLGIKAQVVVMHQGDDVEAGAAPNDCRTAPGGPATAIARAASARVDVFFSAHSHQQYNCVVTDPAGQPRPLIQGLSFGRLLSVVDVQLDARSKDVIRSATTARNEIVTRDVAPDAAVQAIVDDAKTKTAPVANRQIGSITADVNNTGGTSGESPLGDVIADAQLAATTTNGAQIAITNPGGIRASLTYASSPAGEGDGVVTYGEAFTVQPFSNILQTITLTGAQLKTVLEQQFPGYEGQTALRILQVSAGFTYSYDSTAPLGARISNLALNGVPIDPAGSYRVTVNNFLSGGGDGFTTFRQGTALTGGPIDLDAFADYLTANPNLAPPPANRITRLN